ncbi:16S rRNA (cytosine(1402)-N(4))-methyltransferase RsmH [Actinopolyspora mortivallis]|uniref:Ribosomal RNA small subunit methyltransferase H n=1 Tax=Actinopolyspora mortivallis TaxID=33906 RepID=A0A2T0GZE3_ACTMO|nr:16S rRNA (cytosine(1402)-N(4))-methyltransferase [Actinopolyspora mortivallis]
MLLERTIRLLEPALDGRAAVVLDATLGMGGHAEALLRSFPHTTLIGLDRDPQALELARRRLEPYGERVRLVHAVADRIPEVLAEQGVSRLDGVLFDLGVSSLQLDETTRGFSYARDAPLDMRMDTTSGVTAAEVLNTYSQSELTRVLREYGEEKFAARISARVVRERERAPFADSARLVQLVYDSVPAASRRSGGHPAKRVFQALRIEVNGELEVLRRALPAAIDALPQGGRIVVLSYHSLEDRIVKRTFADRAKSRTPLDLPVELPGHGPELRVLTRGAEFADEREAASNPRASSVRLRAAERIQEGV